MHYYKFNIADYRKDTVHLTHLEHGIYRQLLDTYYLDEEPIKTKSVFRRLSISTNEEKTAFENVISDFFTISECGEFYIHARVDEEIEQYKAKADTARANGSKGGRPKKPKKTQSVNSGIAKKTETKANHKPLTINQELINKDLSSELDDSANEIFLYWCATMKKEKSAFSTERKKKVIDRLKDGYTTGEIKTAILNCSNTPHNMGINQNQKQYNDLELICRNSEKLENFRDNPGPLNTIGGSHANGQQSNQHSQQPRLSTIEQSTQINRANHQRTLDEIAALDPQGDYARAMGGFEH